MKGFIINICIVHLPFLKNVLSFIRESSHSYTAKFLVLNILLDLCLKQETIIYKWSKKEDMQFFQVNLCYLNFRFLLTNKTKL